MLRRDVGLDIPLLPFPDRRILPSVQIPISSVTVQNPPALLPPKSACLLPIRPSRRCHSQPLFGVSRQQRYNTLDFPTENRVPTGMLLAPIGYPSFSSPVYIQACPALYMPQSPKTKKSRRVHLHYRMNSAGFFAMLSTKGTSRNEYPNSPHCFTLFYGHIIF